MPKRKVEYAIRIGPFDRYRHLHIQEKGKVVFFRIQYETKIGKNWYPVTRYDTSHGFAHRDLMSFGGHVVKTPLFNQNYNDALTFTESDLKLNWEYYKSKFMEGLDV